MKAKKKLGTTAIVIFVMMLAAVPAIAAATADTGRRDEAPNSFDILDIFRLSPEQLVNALSHE